MDEWPPARLREVTTKIGSGATPRGGKSVYQDRGISFIRSQNVYDGRFSFEGLACISDDAAAALNSVAVSAGDVLINITGESVARTALVAPTALPARVSQHVAIVRPNRELLDSAYLLYALLSPSTKSYLNTLSEAGATRRALTKTHLENTPILLPSLREQKRIAATLSTFDALIETNRFQIATLEDTARTLAANAKSSVNLADIATIVTTKQVRPTGTAEHYSLPAFDAGATPEVTAGASIQSSKLPLTRPCVLVSRLNPHWERCWMAYPAANAVSSTEFVPLVGDGIATEEVWAVTSSTNFWDQMRSRVTGTTGSHQRVDKHTVLTLTVPDTRLLPNTTRNLIVASVRSAKALRDEITDLTHTRDELLPLLMSGTVRVSEDLQNPLDQVG